VIVEVRREVDRVLVDVGEQLRGDPHEPGFRVAVRRGRITIHRPEVPLPVDERIAQRELLHHADERVVHRAVAVRMEAPEHVADDGRGLLERPVRQQAEVVHRVQDSPMNGLETVAHIRQRARHDHAHRVVDERLFDLLVDQTRENAFAIVWAGHEVLREGKTGRIPVGEVYPKGRRMATRAAAYKPLPCNAL
jgi:hypothetical protein